jgi:hypothetical protein
LSLTIALLGCHAGDQDVTQFIKYHTEELCLLILSCHYDIAIRLIQSPQFKIGTELFDVPREALANFDILFEGTIVSGKVITSEIVPRSFSHLTSILLRQTSVTLPKLSRLIRRTLQTDMFSLCDHLLPQKVSVC